METDNNLIKKWILPKPINNDEISNCKINFILQKVLRRRGINLEEDLVDFITPSDLPNPENHFDELKKATQRIISACEREERIAICGDYDADGITSTVLLVELLSKLGAKVKSYIPSRQDDGYGLNTKIINDIYINNIKLIITVDNGVSAFNAIKRANELEIDIIITDHHKIPVHQLDVFSLIHPERAPNNSPYKNLAGVGIAYMLAINICNKLNYNIDHTSSNVLFCIGTVADMAPLIGANRKWLKECLPKINKTTNIGIKTILKKLELEDIDISADDIGYKLAPLINSVGRISNPKLIIDLLTNSSKSSIKLLSKECFSINKERKRITALVEKDAMKIANEEYSMNRKFLVLDNSKWHPGIIGIVAARIVERFNLPTAILSLANDGLFRGSVRSINQIKVNIVLEECSDLLIAYGGHPAAGGFTIKEENIPKLKKLLNNIAVRELKNKDLHKSINPDAYLCFKNINLDFYRQLKLIGPFGLMNKAPIFWTRKCRILDLYNLNGNHLKLKLDDGTAFIDAIKWNYSSDLIKNEFIDIAYYIEINNWKKANKLQLNLIDIKKYKNTIDLQLHKKIYKCQLTDDMKIKVTNTNGQCISSDLSIPSKTKNTNDEIFSKKILSFAEIALGKTT